jgi:hypothetical protein
LTAMEPPAQIAPRTQQNLRCLFEQDPEAQLLAGIRRRLADPLKPEDEDGRFRPHPLVVLLGAMGAIAAGVFFYFGYLRP